MTIAGDSHDTNAAIVSILMSPARILRGVPHALADLKPNLPGPGISPRFGTSVAVLSLIRHKGLIMNDITYFERLLASAERIAHHSWHPGKDQAIVQCLEEIEWIAHDGRISDEQCEAIRTVLQNGCSNAA